MDEIVELFNSLESFNVKVAGEAKEKFYELFSSTKEAWLLNGIFDYYLSSGSPRSVQVLISVREPHDRHLFDRLADTLKGANKLQGLSLLGHVVCRHPSWLYKITNHNLLKILLGLLKTEKDILVLVSALLIVIILLPLIASLLAPFLSDLFEIFSHLAAWSTTNPTKVPETYMVHLNYGLYALFNRLYGMFPCNFLGYLRQHYNSKDSLPVFTLVIKPMLDTVRMHPLLVTASKDLEISPSRWKKTEANDVIMECAKYTIDNAYPRDDYSFRDRVNSFRSKTKRGEIPESNLDSKSKEGFAEPSSHKGPVVSSYSSNLPETGEVWSPAIRSGAATPPEPSSIPHTPVIQGVVSTYSTGNEVPDSPPEAAIEATPESTPIKDMQEAPTERAHSVVGSSMPRALGSFHSQPSSPLRKEAPTSHIQSSTPTALHRVHKLHIERERKQGEREPSLLKPKVGYSPGSPLRVIPQIERSSSLAVAEQGRERTPTQATERSDEDREVESAMKTTHIPSSTSRQVKREDSVLDGINGEYEWRDWRDSGLNVPESRTMHHVARRLRYYSQCQTDNLHLPFIGVISASCSPKAPPKKLRRTLSCPELNKSLEGKKQRILKNQSRQVEKCWVSASTQTDPHIYEHLFLSIFPPLDQPQQHSAPPDVTSPPTFREEQVVSPKMALDTHINLTIKNLTDRKGSKAFESYDVRQLKDQVTLLMLQLQFERHRREVHAERNRRLLGKAREIRALEEHNVALKDQVELMEKEIQNYRHELDRMRRDSRLEIEQHEKKLSYWEGQHTILANRYSQADEKIRTLEEEVKEERRSKQIIASAYSKLEVELFEVCQKLKDAERDVERIKQMKVDLSHLQMHVVKAGERETRLRSVLGNLMLTHNDNQEALISTFSNKNTLALLEKKLTLLDANLCAANQRTIESQNIRLAMEALSKKHAKSLENFQNTCDEKIRDLEALISSLRGLNSRLEEKIELQLKENESLSEKCKNLTDVKVPQGNNGVSESSSSNVGNESLQEGRILSQSRPSPGGELARGSSGPL